MVKCDANGNYIHPSMLRLGMNKCLDSKKSSEQVPSFQEIKWFFVTCITRTYL